MLEAQARKPPNTNACRFHKHKAGAGSNFLAHGCSSLPLCPGGSKSPSSCDLCPSWHKCQTRSHPPGPCCQRLVLQSGSPIPSPQNGTVRGTESSYPSAASGAAPPQATQGKPVPLLAAAHILVRLWGTQGTWEPRCSFHCFIWSLAGSRLSDMV